MKRIIWLSAAIICVLVIAIVFAWLNAVDADGDGFVGSKRWQPSWLSFYSATDCNDSDSLIFPGANDIPSNGIDEDCEGGDYISPDFILDKDNDGFSKLDGDCDDTNPQIHPNAVELFGDSIDSNCDGELDPEPKELVFTNDVVTPDLTDAGRNAREFVQYIQGKTLHIPSPLRAAKIRIEAGVIDSYSGHIGIKLFLETDVASSSQSRNYTEYDQYIHSWFINQECRTLDKKSPGVFLPPNGAVLEYDLQSIPLESADDCTKIEYVNLLAVLNQAQKYNRDVKIGVFTSAAGIGKITKAILIYEGETISSN